MRPQPTEPEGRLNELLERAESLLTSVVAVFLIGFVLIALLAVLVEVRGPLLDDHDFTTATLKGIDASFLAIILLELLHTTLSRGPISQQLQEFLVIGITASIRHGLGIAATRGDPRDVVVNLAINAAGALVLVVGLWLVRHQFCVPIDARRDAGKPSRKVRAPPQVRPASSLERPLFGRS